MGSTTRVLGRVSARRLGVRDAPLSIRRPSKKRRADEGVYGSRLILDGVDAFQLSFWCGTCPLVFERLDGATRTLSSDALQSRLNTGLTAIDRDVLRAASALVPRATYVPLLLSVAPTLVLPSGPGDYFAEEQVAHRGIDHFWGLPQHPRTPYYRGATWTTTDHESLFEFIVPMVPPNWNDQETTARYEEQIRAGSAPTVLALTIVDHTQPWDSFDAHTGLIHFVLDGHHKMEAAARLGVEITLLSLLSVDDSLAAEEDVRAIPDVIGSGFRRDT